MHPTDKSDIVFAVKTWHNNHGTRAEVVKKTWAMAADTVLFFSDEQDASVPTIATGEWMYLYI